MSSLNITHVHRNLHTRVTFMYLEFEDAFVILGIAAFTNVFGRFLHREVAGIPSERGPAVHRSHPRDTSVDRIQIRETPALPLRFSGVAHETADLLRHGAGFSAEADVPDGGRTRMPVTMRQHEANLRQPAFCELLPIRDYLDNVIVRSNGVAGGRLRSRRHQLLLPLGRDAEPNEMSLEALVRSLTSGRCECRCASK